MLQDRLTTMSKSYQITMSKSYQNCYNHVKSIQNARNSITPLQTTILQMAILSRYLECYRPSSNDHSANGHVIQISAMLSALIRRPFAKWPLYPDIWNVLSPPQTTIRQMAMFSRYPRGYPPFSDDHSPNSPKPCFTPQHEKGK